MVLHCANQWALDGLGVKAAVALHNRRMMHPGRLVCTEGSGVTQVWNTVHPGSVCIVQVHPGCTHGLYRSVVRGALGTQSAELQFLVHPGPSLVHPIRGVLVAQRTQVCSTVHSGSKRLWRCTHVAPTHLNTQVHLVHIGQIRSAQDPVRVHPQVTYLGHIAQCILVNTAPVHAGPHHVTRPAGTRLEGITALVPASPFVAALSR